MRDRGDLADRQHRAGRPGHVRQRHEARAGRDRGVERGHRPRIVAIVAGLDQDEVGARSIAQGVQRPDASGVLMARGHDPTA
jgi:hypothetical protein